MYNTTEGYGN